MIDPLQYTADTVWGTWYSINSYNGNHTFLSTFFLNTEEATTGWILMDYEIYLWI